MCSECFDKKMSLHYMCQTKDLKSFKCECLYIDEEPYNIENIQSFPDSSNFIKWSDEHSFQGQTIDGIWENTSYIEPNNIKELYNYCSKKQSGLYTVCVSNKHFHPENTFCNCRDHDGSSLSPILRFSTKDVWQENQTITNNSFVFPNSTLQISNSSFINSNISNTQDLLNYVPYSQLFITILILSIFVSMTLFIILLVKFQKYLRICAKKGFQLIKNADFEIN